MRVTTLGVCLGLVLVSVSGIRTREHLHAAFGAYKEAHNKSYENAIEEKFRLAIFADKKLAIDAHNARYEQGLETYKLGLNQFSDLLHHEFKEAQACMLTLNTTTVGGAAYEPLANLTELPDSVDWRTEGYVTDVKNQGQCGSCWAFSITGALEGQHFKSTGTLVSLSEQDLVDCAPNGGGTGGCAGNFLGPVYDYIQTAGVDTESSYPYEGVDGKACRHDASNVGATLTGHVTLPEGDEAKLQEAVATIGPVSVVIHVCPSFQSYSEGLYKDPTCTGDADHAVLVVGYGTDPDGDYWLVKNSWDTTWGDKGYVKIARNNDNFIQIATQPIYPTV